MGRFVCATFGLCLDRVVGYADCSHTFWGCDLGRNGGDLLCGGILSLLREKRCDAVALCHDDVMSLININKYKMVGQ